MVVHTMAPEWLNQSFFENIITKISDVDESKISRISIKPATKIGDHFGSLMFRVQIEFEESNSLQENLSIIVKISKPGTDEAFETEMNMYTEVIPKVISVLAATQEQGVNLHLPSLLHQSISPIHVILLEDLCDRGYQPIRNFLGYDDCKLIATLISEFHAASMQIQSNEGNLTKFCKPYMLDVSDNGEPFLETEIIRGINVLIKEVETWEGYLALVAKFKDSMRDFSRNVRTVFEIVNNRKYSVLNHADIQFKNLMIKQEPAQVKQYLLLDFQNCTWNTPAIDLYYFLYLVCDSKARQHRDELIELYYDTFTTTLSKIGYNQKIPSFNDLKFEMDEHKILEILLIYEMLWQFVDYTKVDEKDIYGEGEDPVKIQRMIVQTNTEYRLALKTELDRIFHNSFDLILN